MNKNFASNLLSQRNIKQNYLSKNVKENITCDSHDTVSHTKAKSFKNNTGHVVD